MFYCVQIQVTAAAKVKATRVTAAPPGGESMHQAGTPHLLVIFGASTGSTLHQELLPRVKHNFERICFNLQRNFCLSSNLTYFSYLQVDFNCVSYIICTEMLYS